MSATVIEKTAPFCAIECIWVTAKENYLIECWRGNHGELAQWLAFAYLESRGIDTTVPKQAYLYGDMSPALNP